MCEDVCVRVMENLIQSKITALGRLSGNVVKAPRDTYMGRRAHTHKHTHTHTLTTHHNTHTHTHTHTRTTNLLHTKPSYVVYTIYPFTPQNTKHIEHTSRPCEPNCGYLPICLDTNAGNDTFFQNSWIPVPVNVHYQQNTVDLQHFLPMFRYSVQNSYLSVQNLTYSHLDHCKWKDAVFRQTNEVI